MSVEMVGRRVLDSGGDPYFAVTQPGDYCGPDDGRRTGGIPAVWFLLPIAHDDGVPGEARSMHHVQFPPHRFVEEPDGSLTIRESIGAGPLPYYWHGFLTEGRWELDKSKL